MRKTLIAVAVAALSLPAAAAFHERAWLGNVAYFDDTSGITWMDGLRDFIDNAQTIPADSFNQKLLGTSYQSAPTLAQLQSLNRSMHESNPFVHLLDVGPVIPILGPGRPQAEYRTSTTVPVCGSVHPRARQPVARSLSASRSASMEPLVYSFGAGDGYWHPYQDDWPFKLSLRFAVGDVGTPITSAVPEPSTWALLFASLACMAGWRRRQRDR